MARRQFIAKLVRGLPSGFGINGSTIYHRNFRNIVRGILVEGTPYKATWYIWDFMFPFFRVAPFVHLSHSHRISQSGEVSHGGAYFAGTDCEIATTTLHAVERAGMLDDMASVCSPAQFLNRRFPNRNEIASPSDAFDMACAVALCGDTELALSTFHHARDMKHRRAMQFGSKPDDDFFLADINKAMESLGVGLDAFQVHIDRASQAAAAAHGFCAPTVL